MQVRRLTRPLALLVPLSVVAALLTPVADAHAVTYPTLTVSGPSRGNPVTGVDGVFATGSVDPNGTDAPKTLALFVNGTLSDSRACAVPAGTKTCTLSLLFDAGNLTGPQTLRVDFTTVANHVVSSSQTITAYTPPPTAQLTSPPDGSSTPVGSQVDVEGDGSTSLPSDWPRTMELLIDGASVETIHCPFPSSTNTCPTTFTWDTSGLAGGSHTVRLRMTTYHDFVALTAIHHVTLTTTPPPSVTLTAPLAGATVTDLAYVAATGTTAGDDAPYGMFLVVDGHPFGSTELCPPPYTQSCSLSLIWDTTGLSGQHSVAVTFLSQLGEATTAPVTVTVVNPPPTVTITSPLPNAHVAGATQVTAAGLVDDRQTDSVKDMQLIVDGVPSGAAVACSVATRSSCTTTFTWDTSGLTGAHQLQVRFDTTLTSVTSAKTLVIAGTVAPQPVATTLVLMQGPPVVRGSAGVVHGVLSNTQTHLTIVGAPVQVVFTPLSGPARTVTATTDASGNFTATDPDPLLASTAVLATTGPDYSSSSATETLTVKVVITCHVPSPVRRGSAATVTCKAPGLAFGSVVALHWATKTGHGVTYAKVKRGQVRFTTTAYKKGWVTLWATTATTHSFAASRSRTYALHVR
ncbi:hypothetical protein acdb102_26810 [Acidothermaceae bacterium B102]|nr:hypothetical protein acdb102_26810 [Acidothermaceae bacterium B102]